MLGYKLLSCSLCKMGFSSSPAAAPPLPCWQCTGLALKLLWPWFLRVWWCLCGLRKGELPFPCLCGHGGGFVPRQRPGGSKVLQHQELQHIAQGLCLASWVQLICWGAGEQVFGCSWCCAQAGWGSGSFALAACQGQKLRQTAASTKEKHVENRQATGEGEHSQRANTW